jgi:hypothetical protein
MTSVRIEGIDRYNVAGLGEYGVKNIAFDSGGLLAAKRNPPRLDSTGKNEQAR